MVLSVVFASLNSKEFGEKRSDQKSKQSKDSKFPYIVKIQDFYSAEGYSYDYYITYDPVTIIKKSDFGNPPLQCLNKKIDQKKLKEWKDYIDQIEFKDLKIKYLNSGVKGGIQRFFWFDIKGQSKSVEVSNTNVSVLEDLCDKVNNLIPTKFALELNEKVRLNNRQGMKVLARFLGKWKFSGRIKPNNVMKKGLDVKGSSIAEFVLGGNFVKSTGKRIYGDAEIKYEFIYSYEEKNRCFRAWHFYSNGKAEEYDVSWDASQLTFTLKPVKKSEYDSIIEIDFSEKGIQKYKIINKVKNKVIFEMSLLSKRSNN